MGSFSTASEPIHFIAVEGWSYRNGYLIYYDNDGGNQRSFAGVAVSLYKSPFDPEEQFLQVGEHYFQTCSSCLVYNPQSQRLRYI